METSLEAKRILLLPGIQHQQCLLFPHSFPPCSHKHKHVCREQWICVLTKMHQTIPITCYSDTCLFHLSMNVTGQYKCNSFLSPLCINIYANVTFYLN